MSEFEDNGLYDLFICRDYVESEFSFSFVSGRGDDEHKHNYNQRLLCLKSASVRSTSITFI